MRLLFRILPPRCHWKKILYSLSLTLLYWALYLILSFSFLLEELVGMLSRQPACGIIGNTGRQTQSSYAPFECLAQDMEAKLHNKHDFLLKLINSRLYLVERTSTVTALHSPVSMFVSMDGRYWWSATIVLGDLPCWYAPAISRSDDSQHAPCAPHSRYSAHWAILIQSPISSLFLLNRVTTRNQTSSKPSMIQYSSTQVVQESRACHQPSYSSGSHILHI